jgi:hypothetical protein
MVNIEAAISGLRDLRHSVSVKDQRRVDHAVSVLIALRDELAALRNQVQVDALSVDGRGIVEVRRLGASPP